MKVSVIGIHNLKQTVSVSGFLPNTQNTIQSFDVAFDYSLYDIAISLQEKGHDTSLIANFSSAPLSIMALNELEEKGVSVYPDLQTEVTFDLVVNTQDKSYLFKDPSQLTISSFQEKIIKESEYIITNLDSFDGLMALNAYDNDKIILVNALPMYRALTFVQGIVLDHVPENKEETVTSLLQSGLSWMAIENHGIIEFYTLKNKIVLNIGCVKVFLDQFLKAIEENTLLDWLALNKLAEDLD
ncbi:MAG: hypothetical protein GX753_04310 [Erysipelothrix sp.]|nr:hypothetical protein [Erysipelothrix sp.]